MKRDSRRIFSSAEQLGRFSPALLIRFAHKHPEDFKALIESGVIPPEDQADKLDLAAMVPILTSTGVSEELADALFMINAIASPKNRGLLESEMKRRSIILPTPPAESHADFVLRAWLHDPRLLEAAAFRVVMAARRSFAYFVPTETTVAAGIPTVTEATLSALNAKIRTNLGPKSRGRGLTIIPYLDSPAADWYLIRRSRLPERITFHNEEEKEEHKSVWLRVFDVVVFDRLTGVLKVNCREGIEDVYRTAFGSVYARDMLFFDDRSIFTLAPLRSADITTLDCRDIDGLTHVALEYCEFERYRFNTLMKESVQTGDWYAEVAGRSSPVPEGASVPSQAVFQISFTGRKNPTKCHVHQGNRLAFGRDEHAGPIEEFLRKRGFMQHVSVIRHDIAA